MMLIKLEFGKKYRKQSFNQSLTSLKVRLWLLLRLKFQNVMEGSHHTAFMGNSGLLVTRFIVLSTQWMKDMRFLEVSPRVWKIEIRGKKCVALLQGREITVG